MTAESYRPRPYIGGTSRVWKTTSMPIFSSRAHHEHTCLHITDHASRTRRGAHPGTIMAGSERHNKATISPFRHESRKTSYPDSVSNPDALHAIPSTSVSDASQQLKTFCHDKMHDVGAWSPLPQHEQPDPALTYRFPIQASSSHVAPYRPSTGIGTRCEDAGSLGATEHSPEQARQAPLQDAIPISLG